MYHYIKKSIFEVWIKYKKYFSEERPLLTSPVEEIKPEYGQKGKDWLFYRDILIKEGKDFKVKTLEELKRDYDWLDRSGTCLIPIKEVLG